MKITRITSDNSDAFRELMPENIAESDGYLHLGAVSDDNVGCGCISARIEGKVLLIDWLYILPEYREEGAGEKLLKTALLLSKDVTDRAEIVFSADAEGMEEFLSGQDFLVEEDEGIFRVPLSDILYSSMMEEILDTVKTPEMKVKVVSPEFMDGLGNFLKEKGNDLQLLEDISQNLSLVRLNKDGAVTGCLLTRDAGDKDLEVRAFYNDGSVSGISELTVGMYILTRKDYEDYSLVFADREGNAIAYIEKMTGEDIDRYRTKGIYRGICLGAVAK